MPAVAHSKYVNSHRVKLRQTVVLCMLTLTNKYIYIG